MHKQRTFNRLFLLSALAAVALLIGACSQQAAPTYDDGLAVAKDAHGALEARNWKDYAALLHPDELEGFRQDVLPQLERLVTEDRPDSVTFFDRTFDLEEWRTGPAEKFFSDVLWTIFNVSPELRRSFSKMTNNNIGAVLENDTTLHVVVNTQMQIGLQFVNEMNVTSLRKYEGEWKALMSAKIQGIVLMLKQSIESQLNP